MLVGGPAGRYRNGCRRCLPPAGGNGFLIRKCNVLRQTDVSFIASRVGKTSVLGANLDVSSGHDRGIASQAWKTDRGTFHEWQN